MAQKQNLLFLAVCIFAIAGVYPGCISREAAATDETCISYVVDPAKQDIKLFWKDDKGSRFGSIQNLKNWLKQNGRQLLFAMNGGMYMPDHSPQGLYIEQQKLWAPIDTATGAGNFYIQPNGIFFITADTRAAVCRTVDFYDTGNVMYATQSGPMLLTDGQLNPAFKQRSTNLNIRNGVGILPDNRIVFAMSKKKTSFYDFAGWFRRKGCKNALYLDGLVSRTYLPDSNWVQTDGDFGVIIGVTAKQIE